MTEEELLLGNPLDDEYEPPAPDRFIATMVRSVAVPKAGDDYRDRLFTQLAFRMPSGPAVRQSRRVETVKVTSKHDPYQIAGTIQRLIQSGCLVELFVLGAGALNQAVKGIAIARGYLAPGGRDLIMVPTFTDVSIDGVARTAIIILVADRFLR